MLTPAEQLGLAGAALDARVRQAVNYIPDSALAHVARRLAEDARFNEVVYARDGVNEPVRECGVRNVVDGLAHTRIERGACKPELLRRRQHA